MNGLLRITPKGIYCARGDFYIDPWAPVDKAVITHAHSDHARWGSSYYLAHHHAAPILKLRLGTFINLETIPYNESVFINGVKITLFPAGHILGSAQVRVEHGGEVWVASGDYKTEDDGVCAPFEPVRCHHFITESTFGLPCYRWEPQQKIFDRIHQWWHHNRSSQKISVLFGYSLGKAQRIIENLDSSIGSIFTHTAIHNTQKAFRDYGVDVRIYPQWTPDISKGNLAGSLILAPPSAFDSPWMKRFTPYATGVCSGWMQLRGLQRRRNADAGFALSDHADWPGLLDAIKSTGAQKVYVTHGYQSIFARYLQESGIDAEEISTAFGEEETTEEATA
ncbi:MAG: ligase-associated DNA damage response exonuclease [Chitinophagales bacterium]